MVELLHREEVRVASHRTKDKGDFALGLVISEFLRHGLAVLVPLSEHQPYDLVTSNDSGVMRKIQIKYRSLSATGIVTISMRNTYSDRNGWHEHPVDKSGFDCYAIYCPESDRIYYIRTDEIPESQTKAFCIRVIPCRNNQKRRVRLAQDYEDISRIFAEPQTRLTFET